MTPQIKSKERVFEHGEVFTNTREVKAMLNMVQQEAVDINSIFLEPACGNGNFLAEILMRKLKSVEQLYRNDGRLYFINLLRAVASIYGIDIQEDNVKETKERLYNLTFSRCSRLFAQKTPAEIQKAIQMILNRNIQCGNTLTFSDSSRKPLLISEWDIDDKLCITRKDYDYKMMVETGCETNPVCVYPKIQIIPSKKQVA